MPLLYIVLSMPFLTKFVSDQQCKAMFLCFGNMNFEQSPDSPCDPKYSKSQESSFKNGQIYIGKNVGRATILCFQSLMNRKKPITFPSYEYRPYAILTRGLYIRNPLRTQIYSRFFFLKIQDFCIVMYIVLKSFVIKSGYIKKLSFSQTKRSRKRFNFYLIGTYS